MAQSSQRQQKYKIQVFRVLGIYNIDPMLEIRWTTRLNGYLAEKTTQMMLGAGKTEWLHCTAAAAVQQWAQSFSEFESWFSRIVVFTVKFNLGILAILDNQKTVAVWDIYQWYTH